MAFLTHYWRSFHDFLDAHGDPYTNQWFLMGSPIPTLTMSLLYVYIVKRLGPHLMEDRKPFTLKTTLIVYNLVQVILSAWLFYEIGMAGWLTGEYSWRCQPMDYSGSSQATRMRAATWWYLVAKFSEFFDTFFFVMRKKYGQVSTLHVIHHSIMPCLTWSCVKFFPDGHGTFSGLLNTYVHIIMYSYYFLAGLGQQVQKYLWWKKYITALQLAQFTAIILHSTQLLVFKCDYPKGVVFLQIASAFMFFAMFRAFYAKAYTNPTPSDKAKGTVKSRDARPEASASTGSRQDGDSNTTVVQRRPAASDGTGATH